MRARRATALIGEADTGSAAITAGSAHTRAVPATTTDHLRHAPRLCPRKLRPHPDGNLTGSAVSPLLPRNQSTSGRGPGAPERASRKVPIRTAHEEADS